jgi:hypothetical protein
MEAQGSHCRQVSLHRAVRLMAVFASSNESQVFFFNLRVHVTVRPANNQKLFNLHHASLQNVIEHIIGVCKHYFKLMVAAPEYNLWTQAKIPLALGALQNFICIHNPTDDAETTYRLSGVFSRAIEWSLRDK